VRLPEFHAAPPGFTAVCRNQLEPHVPKQVDVTQVTGAQEGDKVQNAQVARSKVEPVTLEQAVWLSQMALLWPQQYDTLGNYHDGRLAPKSRKFVSSLSGIEDVRGVRQWPVGGGTSMWLHVEGTALGSSNRNTAVQHMRAQVQKLLVGEWCTTQVCPKATAFGKDARAAAVQGAGARSAAEEKRSCRDNRCMLQILALDEEGQESVGAAVVHVLGPALAYIDHLTIRPHLRSGGLGQKFAHAILAVLARCGVQGAFLEAIVPQQRRVGGPPGGPVVQFWAKAGFVPCSDEDDDAEQEHTNESRACRLSGVLMRMFTGLGAHQDTLAMFRGCQHDWELPNKNHVAPLLPGHFPPPALEDGEETAEDECDDEASSVVSFECELEDWFGEAMADREQALTQAMQSGNTERLEEHTRMRNILEATRDHVHRARRRAEQERAAHAPVNLVPSMDPVASLNAWDSWGTSSHSRSIWTEASSSNAHANQELGGRAHTASLHAWDSWGSLGHSGSIWTAPSDANASAAHQDLKYMAHTDAGREQQQGALPAAHSWGMPVNAEESQKVWASFQPKVPEGVGFLPTETQAMEQATAQGSSVWPVQSMEQPRNQTSTVWPVASQTDVSAAVPAESLRLATEHASALQHGLAVGTCQQLDAEGCVGAQDCWSPMAKTASQFGHSGECHSTHSGTAALHSTFCSSLVDDHEADGCIKEGLKPPLEAEVKPAIEGEAELAPKAGVEPALEAEVEPALEGEAELALEAEVELALEASRYVASSLELEDIIVPGGANAAKHSVDPFVEAELKALHVKPYFMPGPVSPPGSYRTVAGEVFGAQAWRVRHRGTRPRRLLKRPTAVKRLLHYARRAVPQCSCLHPRTADAL
jgi:GNAT superfamily N-acetyltransferase